MVRALLVSLSEKSHHALAVCAASFDNPFIVVLYLYTLEVYKDFFFLFYLLLPFLSLISSVFMLIL